MFEKYAQKLLPHAIALVKKHLRIELTRDGNTIHCIAWFDDEVITKTSVDITPA